ncbi:tectonin beta-propeller repeat-containing protein 2-like [Pollicipes pollicipes]|uniref:tectonin beta-propeller repeat-containing protein 2-like n=1 Tax=Pollicipes pollicipes TaxID=41117 RepID=UPI001884F4D0|nr:tectonin beta-propeller repeat-containing protein 2-like [Pollicipes pollicipes]XP_037072447.1 tectonin beta-propeller repeat-containing protein 2-like [Pollicipes pollicipes]
MVGTHWEPATGLAAAQLALAPGAVWGRASSGAVHRWLEAGQQWCRVPGSTRHVSASVSGELWVVHAGGLYTLHDLWLRPGQPVRPQVQPGAADAEDRDWELVTC